MAMSARTPAVFIDKDGTLIEDVPYNVDPRRIRFVPGAAGGVRRLHDCGYRLVIVSNQAGVAYGRFAPAALEGVHTYLQAAFAAWGAHLAGFYCCPHHPAGRVQEYAVHCICRKPAPGLLRRAANELHLDLARSWMVGDILHDVEAGRRAGCRTVLIDNGNETQWRASPLRQPHFTTQDFVHAAQMIVAHGSRGAVEEGA